METAQIATAPAPATIRTACRSGSRKDTVARVKRINPARSTKPTGRIAFSCQFMRTELARDSSPSDEKTSAPPLPDSLEGRTGVAVVSAVPAIDFAENCVWLGIRVKSRKQVRDAEEGEHHNDKAENREVGGTPATPSASDAHVKIACVHEPGNGCPGFFRIPTPIRAPGLVRPVRSGSDHEG